MKNKQINKDKTIQHNAFFECTRIMCYPILLNFLTQVTEELLLIFSADILGRFADAVFNLELDVGIKNVAILVGCVLISVFVIPGLNLCSDFIMLKKSLIHDNLVFSHYLDKDIEKAAQLNVGEIQYELEDAPNTFRIKLVVLASKAVAIPIGLVYLLYNTLKVNWILTILMLVLASIRLVIPVFLRKKIAQYDIREKEYQAKRRACETDMTINPGIIRLFGIENAIVQRINQMYMDYHTKTEKNYIACQVMSQHFLSFFETFTQLLLLIAGAIMVAKNIVTPGQLTSVLVYLSVTHTFLSYIGEIIHDYPLMKNALNRVCMFYKDIEISTGKSINRFDGLNCKNISYSYGEKQILSNINFSIIPGEKICFVGKNGCGKSTLGKIINASLKNYSGIITVGNIKLNRIQIDDWRKLIAYSPQAPYIFQTTVRENITIGNPSASYDEINTLMEMFSILPLADKTLSTDSDLSGGERQKISVARALLKKAPLLILDEPTNHMDQKSICALMRYISETDQTVIVISHDPSIQQVTRIIEI